MKDDYQRRLPDGTYTLKKAEYLDAWIALGKKVEAVTGWKLSGFDPSLTFDGPNEQSVQIPVAFAQAIAASYVSDLDWAFATGGSIS